MVFYFPLGIESDALFCPVTELSGAGVCSGTLPNHSYTCSCILMAEASNLNWNNGADPIEDFKMGSSAHPQALGTALRDLLGCVCVCEEAVTVLEIAFLNSNSEYLLHLTE